MPKSNVNCSKNTGSSRVEGFKKSLLKAIKNKESEEKEQKEVEIEKLKLVYPLYNENPTDKSVVQLQPHVKARLLNSYDATKLFKAGEKVLNPAYIDILKKMGYSESGILVAGQQETPATSPAIPRKDC